MKQLFNASYAGKSLMTADGIIEFDENGVAQVENDNTADNLAALPNFAIYGDEGATPPPADTGDTPDENGAGEHAEGSEGAENGAAGDNTQPDGDDNQNGNEGEQEPEQGAEGDQTPADESKSSTIPTKEDGSPDIDALNKLTVPSLKKLAKDNGFNTEGHNTKAELIRLMTAAE